MIFRTKLMIAVALALASCSGTSGVIEIAPGTYTVSEMRAPAVGGGPAARAAVLAHSAAFCTGQGRTVVPLELRPDGDPYTPYYPTAFDATFRCK